MVTKGIIKSIDLTGNTCKVHMPFFETAGNDPIIATATISNTPGSYNGYKVGDVVLVAFEDNNLDTPVVMGKLYLGVEKEKADPRGVLNVEESSTSKKAALPADSVLTSKVDNNVTNTAAPFGSLSSIANELNTLNTNVDQMDRDYGNRFKQVITEMGNQGENFESKLEQTAQSITATVTSTKEELQENIDAVQDNVDQTNKDLADAKDEFSKTITETKTALEVEDGKIKASVEEVSKTVSAHGETIASHTTQISQNTENITLEASARQEAVSNLDKNISENTALIKENAANIKINADSISQEVTAREEALSGAVKELESKITSTSDGINAQVTERLAEKLDIKNNGESTTEEGQVTQHGFGWDLSKDAWLIKAYDQNSEGTLPIDGLDIFKITRDTVEINALNVRLTGYPRETIIRYAYGTKDTYPALYKDNTKKSIKDEFINAAWSKTELPWSEAQYIWQWTQTAKYEYVEENSDWVDSITDNVVRQSGDSAISYWLKCSTPIHIGKNQTENILVIPYKKVGTKAEELDTEAYIRYKWVKDDNAEFTSWTKISSSGLTINATDIKASDLLVQVSHDSTGDNRNIYDEETITYSPLNTPIIDLTNDKAIIQYKPNGEQITAAVSSTATVYLGGMILSDTTYKWKKKEGITSITGTNTSTVTVNSITSDTAIITCEATTPFKDETGANVVLSKDFTIFRETITATYNLKVSTPIHTGDLQKAIIKVEALATLGNTPEIPDENAYLRYSLNNGDTWQPWSKQSELEILTTGCEKDIIVQASHDSGTTIYEQETITYSPLNTPVLDLNNDNATISYNADNTKINNTETVSSTASVYLNGKRVTSYKIDWISPDESCIYTISEDKHTITITDINNVNNSNIATARCIVSEIEGYPNLELTKDFNIIKQVQGVISYSLKTSIDNFVRDTNNVINPANLTFQIIEKVGNKNSSFVIPTTTNKLRLEVFKGTTLLSLTADENNTYTIDNTNIDINTPIIIKLYQESILIATKTIHVIYSGEKGDTGESNYIIEIDNDFATVPTSVVNKQIYRKDGLLDLPINESITPEIKENLNLPGGVFNPKNIVKTNILEKDNASDLEITNVLRFTPMLNTRAAINKYLPGIPLSIISGPDVENNYQYDHQKNYQFLRAPLISLPEAQLEIKDSTNTVTEYKSYTQDLTTHKVKVYYGTALEDITMDNFILKLDHDEITLEDLYAEKGNYLVCEIKAYDKDGNLVEDYPSINPTINDNTVTNYITAMSGTTNTVSTVAIIYTYYIVKELDGQKIMANVASSKVELVRHLGPTTYYMNSSATSIKVDKNNNVAPDSISFTAHKLSTSDNSITDFTTGTWKYYWDNDISNTQIENNLDSLVINDGDTINEKIINFKDKNTLTVELYTNDQLWDRTTIDVIKDGSDGPTPVSSVTYYKYAVADISDPEYIKEEEVEGEQTAWASDLTELPDPFTFFNGKGYFCWTKTVILYSDGKSIPDGPNKDAAFALAQGKTTNYYSPTDPWESGHKVKEGDCWFSTISITEYFPGEETENNNITKQYSFKTLPRTIKKIETVKDLYEFYISVGQNEYLQISKNNLIDRNTDLFVSYNNTSYHISKVQSDSDSTPLEDKSLTDLDIEQIYIQSITPPTLRQWDGSQWQDIGGELVANKVTANFINALDITAKKVTVLQDSSDVSSPILFEADGTGSTGKVKIGGFDVSGSELIGTNSIDGISSKVLISPKQISLRATSEFQYTILKADEKTVADLNNSEEISLTVEELLGKLWEMNQEMDYIAPEGVTEERGEYDYTRVDLTQFNINGILLTPKTQIPYFYITYTYLLNEGYTQAPTFTDYYFFYKNKELMLPSNDSETLEIKKVYSIWQKVPSDTIISNFNVNVLESEDDIETCCHTLTFRDECCLITSKRIELAEVNGKFEVTSEGKLTTNSGIIGSFTLKDSNLTVIQKSTETEVLWDNMDESVQQSIQEAGLPNGTSVFDFLTTNLNLNASGLSLSLSSIKQARSKDNSVSAIIEDTKQGYIKLDPYEGIVAGIPYSETDTPSTVAEGEDNSESIAQANYIYPFKVSIDGKLTATEANIGDWSLKDVELYNKEQGIILNKDGLNLENGRLLKLANDNFVVLTQEKVESGIFKTDNITYIGNKNGGTFLKSFAPTGSLYLTSDNIENIKTASASIKITLSGTNSNYNVTAEVTGITNADKIPEAKKISLSYSYIIATGVFGWGETTKTGTISLTLRAGAITGTTVTATLNQYTDGAKDVVKAGTTVTLELTPTLKASLTASDSSQFETIWASDYFKFLTTDTTTNTGTIYSLGHLLPNTYGSNECNLGSNERPWTTFYVENIWVEKINGVKVTNDTYNSYEFGNKATATCVSSSWPDESISSLDVTTKTDITTNPITGGTCFDAGTKITMADGSLKNIEEIKMNDLVLSYNIYTNSFDTAKVLDTYKFNTTQDLVLLTFEDDTQIHTTMTHPFYTTSGWVSLKPNYDYNSYEDLSTQLFEMMTVGQYFYQTTSTNKLKELKLVRIQYKHGVKKDHLVYNLNIDNTNTFFAEGILGHNINLKTRPGFNIVPIV